VERRSWTARVYLHGALREDDGAWPGYVGRRPRVGPGDAAGDGVAQRHQLGPILELRLDLQDLEQLRNAVHHVIRAEQTHAERDDLLVGAVIARRFHHLVAQQPHGFGIVEFEALGSSPAGHLRDSEDGQPIHFFRAQMHVSFLLSVQTPALRLMSIRAMSFAPLSGFKRWGAGDPDREQHGPGHR